MDWDKLPHRWSSMAKVFCPDMVSWCHLSWFSRDPSKTPFWSGQITNEPNIKLICPYLWLQWSFILIQKLSDIHLLRQKIGTNYLQNQNETFKNLDQDIWPYSNTYLIIDTSNFRKVQFDIQWNPILLNLCCIHALSKDTVLKW